MVNIVGTMSMYWQALLHSSNGINWKQRLIEQGRQIWDTVHVLACFAAFIKWHKLEAKVNSTWSTYLGHCPCIGRLCCINQMA